MTNTSEPNIEELIVNVVNQTLQTAKNTLASNGWLSLKDGAKYAGVSYNTFIKFREMGLQVCEIEGIKRVSRKEIDRFLQENSF